MKKDMPLEGLRWSRDSGSVLYDTPKTAVIGRAGGGGFTWDSCPEVIHIEQILGNYANYAHEQNA